MNQQKNVRRKPWPDPFEYPTIEERAYYAGRTARIKDRRKPENPYPWTAPCGQRKAWDEGWEDQKMQEENP